MHSALHLLLRWSRRDPVYLLLIRKLYNLIFLASIHTLLFRGAEFHQLIFPPYLNGPGQVSRHKLVFRVIAVLLVFHVLEMLILQDTGHHIPGGKLRPQRVREKQVTPSALHKRKREEKLHLWLGGSEAYWLGSVLTCHVRNLLNLLSPAVRINSSGIHDWKVYKQSPNTFSSRSLDFILPEDVVFTMLYEVSTNSSFAAGVSEWKKELMLWNVMRQTADLHINSRTYTCKRGKHSW